jgi:hypothetical protein
VKARLNLPKKCTVRPRPLRQASQFHSAVEMAHKESGVDGYINPLVFFSLDSAYRGAGGESTVDPGELVGDLLPRGGMGPDGTQGALQAIRARYERLSEPHLRLFLAPAEETILDKIIWPLRAAKRSFILGDFLGCIALSGVVAEMVFLLRFDVAKPMVGPQPMGDREQRLLLGRAFEKLGQERRTQVLLGLGLIAEEQATRADKIREIRRRYMHLFGAPAHSVEDDSAEAYSNAVVLVKDIVGLAPRGKGVFIQPWLRDFLRGKGLLREGLPE